MLGTPFHLTPAILPEQHIGDAFMNSFSQRKGLKSVKSILQVDSMDEDLRNGLWNALEVFYWGKASRLAYRVSDLRGLDLLLHFIWRDFFKKPVDEIPELWLRARTILRNWFFDSPWNEVYDFIEFLANNSFDEFEPTKFMGFCNTTLEREMSAYRFVDGVIVQLTSDQEIAEIERAINSPTPLKPVSIHLRTALELLADKSNPDYRNSIKESVSAVESMCNLITGSKDSLGDALKKVEGKMAIHPALKKGFSNLYGYTSDASGIRHALLEEPNLDFEDSKYMLISCSAFINYLAAKAAKAGIKF
jgi:hypothetical protein